MTLHLLSSPVTIPRDSALPEDVSVNNFFWQWDDTVAGFTTYPLVSAAITTLLTNFYQAFDQHLALTVASPATVKVYDYADAQPRIVRGTGSITLTPGTGDPLPAEVAVCLSYQADPFPGEPQARRRGRIFIGPINGPAGSLSGNDWRPTSTCRTDIANAASALAAAGGTALDWLVYSRSDAVGRPITNGWVDNAFDTQRRRGLAATARTLWS